MQVNATLTHSFCLQQEARLQVDMLQRHPLPAGQEMTGNSLLAHQCQNTWSGPEDLSCPLSNS